MCAPLRNMGQEFSHAPSLNLYQLLPVARTCETMRDLFTCHISQATVQRAARFCSAKLVSTEQRIKASIRDSAVIGADETGLRVAGGNGWIHVARTDGFAVLVSSGAHGETEAGDVAAVEAAVEAEVLAASRVFCPQATPAAINKTVMTNVI